MSPQSADPARAGWPVRVLEFPATREGALDPTLEWLVTNGMGGYASGPVCGGLTRRYHGLLVAAHPPPWGRLVCVSALRTHVLLGERAVLLDHENLATLDDMPYGALREFKLDAGMPVWTYDIDGIVMEKRIVMERRRNTTWVIFRLLSEGPPVRIEIDPMMNVRPHEASVEAGLGMPTGIHVRDHAVDIAVEATIPRIRMTAHGHGILCTATALDKVTVEFGEEGFRGYHTHGDLWNPCRIVLGFDDAGIAALSISSEAEDLLDADPMAAWEAERSRRARVLDLAGAVTDPFEAELILAADQFLIVPVGHASAATAAGESDISGRSVIAGYHWFTDWGRDTMISLDGLALKTGRGAEAALILDTFGRHVRDGLIPNLFPEGQRLGLYHTADATLWFFEAVQRYRAHTGDWALVERHLPQFVDIIRHHRQGTLFGIGVDPADGLLRQGAPGYALTWMDAKVDGWVVTPRRGKAVEINALWFNALRLMSDWLEESGDADEAECCRSEAARAQGSFNRRFWNPETGWLFDLVDGEDGDDPACRPNQLLAISLTHPILDTAHWTPVLTAVRDRLLTPLGLRTLAPGHPDYRSQYTGNLTNRDAAYHQGTVWPWLIGPYVDAALRTSPHAVGEVREALAAFRAHLGAAGIGSISEIFDAEPPHLPRGCVAQAWSVAEVLRAWKNTAPAVRRLPILSGDRSAFPEN